jgi:hypothetical protein
MLQSHYADGNAPRPEPGGFNGLRPGRAYDLGMPQRSTPFQAIVRLLRQHVAQPGVTVTESKFLRDVVLGIEREVDIVVEGEFDGEPVVVSLEVIEHSRPASLTWVEQMIGKHRNLPTNRLLLVSKSGFTRNALAAVDREAGRVQALRPELITRDGQPVVKSLFADAIKYAPTGCNLHVRFGGDERIVVRGTPPLDVYDKEGSLRGPLFHLVWETVCLDAVRRALSFEAHHRSDKDQVKAFSLGLSVPQLGYQLLRMETTELHLIERLEIWGEFAVSQTEIPLTLANLGGRIYGSGEAPIDGRPAVWVGTTDQAAQKTTISWQTTDGQEPPQRRGLNRPTYFPELIDLFPMQALVVDSINASRNTAGPSPDGLAPAREVRTPDLCTDLCTRRHEIERDGGRRGRSPRVHQRVSAEASAMIGDNARLRRQESYGS